MQAKYDRIGKSYNQTRKADPYISSRLWYHLQSAMPGQCLDIGCGTGNYTIALHQKGIDFIGVDPSHQMLATAQSRPFDIDWRQGVAEHLPLNNESVCAVLASLTLHHWTSLTQGFQEAARVLQKDGKLVIFTATPRQMDGYWLNHYFPKMLAKSKTQMPSFEHVQNSLQRSGFQVIQTEKYFVRDDQADLFLYAGKNRPSLYLDEKVRQGISSFSDLANAREVEEGLQRLANDIESGAHLALRQQYQNQEGDYLFITAQPTSSHLALN